MRTDLSADTLAAIAGEGVVLVQLVLMEFPSGNVALNTSNRDLVFGGVTYKGAYGLGQIGAIVDSPGDIKGLQLSIDGGPAEMIALALDDADEVQGTPLTIRDAIMSIASLTILDAPVAWAGQLDTMSLSEDGETASIAATAESRAVVLLRGTPLTYSNADQQTLHPGDRAFEYVVGQAGKPIIWPAREFFFR